MPIWHKMPLTASKAYTEIDLHTKENNLKEPNWELWFDERVKKVVEVISPFSLSLMILFSRALRPGKTTGSRCCLTLSHLTIPTSMRGLRA